MRTIVNHHQANHMIKIYDEVKSTVDDGGLAYETSSAIWAYSPSRKRVTLYVKNPTPMTNEILDYTPSSKHYELHRERIIRLTKAVPTAFTTLVDNLKQRG